ncbi:MAG: phosphoadenosine phosphosulfate reductase family protein [Prevotella sp.]|nr:phosphoadenosine phosphosulfate reductase family protein [Staphylococcus sp.]MCM1350104.1 phosphoadenosine phosphosulfate reductase family protein [Prevotella sp.]
MYKAVWYKKNNLILLVDSNINQEEELNSPRVVYTDELRLLGIDKYTYAKENKPVCWCIDRKYYYDRKFIFEAKGGDIYHEPRINYPSELPVLSLKPIDVDELKKINSEKLFSLQNEAMDFINEQYNYYSKRVDAFAVAFSGGKDSQVTLDLVARVIPPDKYKVYYTDTGMEIPCTYETVEQTKTYYKRTYPNFELIYCDSDVEVIEQWKKYGSPSRMNRWCCKVRKTALFTRKLKDFLNINKQPKCVVFEGVRAEESSRREGYDRVGEGVKHVHLINCRPIFNWSNTEIYIYMLCLCNIPINKAYTFGLTRVGCNICPFASSWSEFIIHRVYPNITKPYIQVIEEMAKNIGVSDKNKINDYISSGNWKKNAGGKGLSIDETRMDILKKDPNYECVIKKPKQEWKIWLTTVGKYTLNKIDATTYHGEIKILDNIMKFSVIDKDDKLKVSMSGTSGKLGLTSLLNKALTKTAYCDRCGVCEAECPTGALTIRKNEFTIDPMRCIQCHKCYEVNSYGCIVAARRRISEGGISMSSSTTKTSGVDRYSTFGLKEEWVRALVDMGNDWFLEYPGLGNKMIPAAINWFRDAEIVDKKEKKLSEFGYLFCQIFKKNEYLAWQIMWINLSFNSPIINCYINDLLNDTNYNKDGILTLLQYRYPDLKENTLSNPIGAIFNMFEHTPFGCSQEMSDFEDYSLKMGAYKTENRERFVKKIGSENISKISITYMLYYLAEQTKSYEYSVSDFYERKIIGPKLVFNYPLEKFHSVLRSLTELGYLSADLLGGLDNIHLNKKFKSLDILREMVDKI